MPRSRPRRAFRPPLGVRVARIAVPVVLVGLGTSGVVAFAGPGAETRTAEPAPQSVAAAVAPFREQPVSRDQARLAVPSPSPTPSPTSTPSLADAQDLAPTADELAAHPKVVGSMWSTDDLNIRKEPSKGSQVVTVVKPGTKLSVTKVERDGFRLVSFKDKGRWVTAQYLSSKKPDPVTSSGVSHAPCAKGSAMEQGLTPDAILVHRTVCAHFPQVTSYGGLRGGGGGFHPTGQAVDCMISDSTIGWQIAHWVRAHARELGVSEVIYSQHIWTVQRSGEGWRSMSDRGSRTANHYDHVHVSVYGHSAA